MAQQRRWIDLRTGLISAAAVAAAAILILTFGRVGSLHGKTFKLYVSTDAARGVIRGTEVWLDGQRVGLVHAVRFRPPTVSPKERLVLDLDVLESARDAIRFDTRVQVRSGGTIIGDQVVYLTSGTTKTPEVASGDTIRAGEQPDIESMSSEAALAAREFPPILQNVKLLATQLHSAEGALGAFGLDHGGSELARIEARSKRLLDGLSNGDGTIGAAMAAKPELEARATRAMAQFDSIRILLASGDHSLGRFRRDTTLIRDVGRIRAELFDAKQLADSGSGTVARLRTDSAVVRNVHQDYARVDSLFADMKKHPLRYIAF